MAKQYFALNKIEHGDTVFMPGDVVEGLTKEQMVALWEADVLTEVDPDQQPPDARDNKIADLEKQIAQLKADAANTEGPQGESPETAIDEKPKKTEEKPKDVAPTK
jgi:hypothetical protein